MSGLDESTEPAEHEARQAHTQGEEAAVAAIEDTDSARPGPGLELEGVPEVAEAVEVSEPSTSVPESSTSVPEPAASEPTDASIDGPAEPVAPDVGPADASEPVAPDVGPADASEPVSAAVSDVSGGASEPVAPDVGPADASEPVSAAVSDASVDAPAQPAAPTPQIGATKEAGDGTIIPPAAQRPKSITETGKIVEGVVTAVSADSVELTLDDGRPAVINRPNFSLTNEEPSAVLSVGDRAFGAELAREDPKARVVLSRTWALKRQAWERIVDHASNNKLLSAKVVSASKKGLVVDVGVRGFVPASHLELEPVADMSSYVDQVLELKVLEVDPRREKLVLSRRSQLLKAQRKEVQELLQSLKPGEVRSGTVASLADYGVFVDLGGVSGLVHISELSWQRVGKPAQVVSVGDKVDVKILDIKPKKKRISLSMRQVAPDPLKSIEVGSVLIGAVTRLVDFGAFVAIGEFEGLVHLSELAEYRVSTPEEIVAPGDEVGVKVLSIDAKRRRIELSIRRAAEYDG